MDASGELREDIGLHTGKRKRYDSSDDPMYAWIPYAQDFLDETIRHAEFGNSSVNPCCATCQWMWKGKAHSLEGEAVAHTLYCCRTCGEFFECRDCCCRRHQRLPLHKVEMWNGDFWEDSMLEKLGLIFQLGHGGRDCPIPRPLRWLTVLHVNGIHRVHVAYCGCNVSDSESRWRQIMRNGWYPAMTTDPHSTATFECLDTFRLLNMTANINIRDYMSFLEQSTDPYGTEWVPDRYKAFGRMSRQWAYLKRLRRAGIGHLKEGLVSAEAGSVAIQCWACPREGVNLPSEWADVAEEDQYLYRLFVGLDANFRLKNRLRHRNHLKKDRPLYDGLGYQVPQKAYFTHLKNYMKEDDISTCIAFAALMEKETKLSTGLRCTGVGGCVCIRHELICPSGIGDLLKGERYTNMDFIFWSALR
ncbi:hypothetical protein EV421DRAFT_1945930 [Armillaria borealis]|uniref:CxC2-like cysteine cluster KDZ transposase-associated domain-containing protein n=1 Tax=Armillaria borealis TaxID=47425 RepID=A0AA39MDG5_9AGAR|nr:hypothetical protein EV421DRAFT_1945930 [Armillaria borealis]